MARPDDAERLFRKGIHCGRAVVLTYGGAFGLGQDEVLDMASGLSGEIGHGAGPCGAVEGAYLLLAAKQATGPAADRLKRFIDLFTARFGSVDCEALLGHPMRTREDRAEVREQELIQTLCPEVVRGTGEVLEEFL